MWQAGKDIAENHVNETHRFPSVANCSVLT